MKKTYYFLPIFLFISPAMYSQALQDTPRGKVSEQKEIKATNHLRKEMEQKQLTAPPERIPVSMPPAKITGKTNNKKCKDSATKQRNKSSK